MWEYCGRRQFAVLSTNTSQIILAHIIQYTFKGRFMVDVFVSLFLFGMHGFGVAMAIITLVAIIGIRALCSSYPGAFEELFVSNSAADGGFDSPYGGMPSESNFTPQPSADL